MKELESVKIEVPMRIEVILKLLEFKGGWKVQAVYNEDGIFDYVQEHAKNCADNFEKEIRKCLEK